MIIVKEGSARAPALIVCSRSLGDIQKRPVSFVQIRLVVTEVSDIQIRPAVIVDVTDGHTHSVTGRQDTAVFSDIGELESSSAVFRDHEIISEQPAARWLCFTPGKQRVAGFYVGVKHVS